MKMFIRSATCISPQKTFDNPLFLDELVEYNGNRLTCIEPDHSTVIDPKLIRRMSRIIKMSVTAALKALKLGNIANPDAIVTGTAYGCLEDTGTFLSNIIEQNEEPIAPTAFVQSTHNTIGAQVALLLKCKHYNNTFVNGGASFEHSLQDAMMLLAEGNVTNVLVGGMDEITDASHTILSRMGLYKREPLSNLDLFQSQTKGTINGEGSAFFVLTDTPNADNLAQIDAVGTFYKPADVKEAAEHIKLFLKAHNVDITDIDLLITGQNGDIKNDKVYPELQTAIFGNIPSVKYKHLCGEYPTSTAFATWLGANIINTSLVPTTLKVDREIKKNFNKILVYNHYQNIYHSLILLSTC